MKRWLFGALLVSGCVDSETNGESGGGDSDGGSTATNSGSGSAGSTTSVPTLDVPPPVDCADTGVSDPLRWLGSASAPGHTGLRSVAALAQTAWTCADQGGLVTWDVSGDAPVVVSDDGQPCSAVAVDPSTGRLAVARGTTVELLEPDGSSAAPGPFTAEGPVNTLSFDGDRLLVAAGGWAVLDAETLQPLVSYSDDSSDSRALAASADSIVVADGRAGLRIFEAQGATATLRGTVPLNGPALDVAVQGSTALIATMHSVAAVDISDPASPTPLSETETPGSAMRLVAQEGRVTVSDFTAVLQVDTANLAALGIVNAEPLLGGDPLDRTRAIAADLDRERVYVAQWSGLQVYETGCEGSAPALAPELAGIEFGAVAAGDDQSRVVPIRNLGDAPLSLNGVSSDLDGVSSDFAPITLAPGEATTFEVSYAASDTQARTGQLRIESDDPDQPTYVLSVSANVPGAGIGDPMVPFRSVDVRGRVWSNEDAAGRVLLLAYFADW